MRRATLSKLRLMRSRSGSGLCWTPASERCKLSQSRAVLGLGQTIRLDWVVQFLEVASGTPKMRFCPHEPGAKPGALVKGNCRGVDMQSWQPKTMGRLSLIQITDLSSVTYTVAQRMHVTAEICLSSELEAILVYPRQGKLEAQSKSILHFVPIVMNASA